jgi:hypothetical protein
MGQLQRLAHQVTDRYRLALSLPTLKQSAQPVDDLGCAPVVADDVLEDQGDLRDLERVTTDQARFR